jgi:SAM-dependent methyltransferase
MSRDPRSDWSRYDADRIPTKVATPRLDAFLDAVQRAGGEGYRPAVLDLGCGNGRIAMRMHACRFSVVGVDINEQAIHAARAAAAGQPQAAVQFHHADIAAEEFLSVAGGPFDAVVCQLVISIIGGPPERLALLRNARSQLRPGGRLYLSASGVSGDVNPGYARLYAEDVALTGERHTYYSRDTDGTVLYATHHFTAEELAFLLESAGFEQVAVTRELESSSRRPEESAAFLYATCRGP